MYKCRKNAGSGANTGKISVAIGGGVWYNMGMNELISAISTAQGKGGVAIVRVSGDGALPLARAMFSRKGEFVPNMLYAGTVDCGDFSDYGMCVYFKAPRSFTGEDVVEFHLHGGTEIARGALLKTVELGARLARAGEFTRRAFLNGKLSLSACEGMGEMIEAQSKAQVRAGFLLYGEKLTEEAKRLQGVLKERLAAVEADVDYPEEDLSEDVRTETCEKLRPVLHALETLKGQYRTGKKIKCGVNVALCGKPNAGKSSLLNALLGYDRAIVSSVPGTTRDVVEGTLEIGGVLFRLTDTAGLRESTDEVEREGIRRAENAIRSADLILSLSEGELPCGVPVIRVGAKCDLGRQEDCDINVSAVTGEGIEELKQMIYERGFGAESDEGFLLEERHYGAVCDALSSVRAALEGAEGGLPSDLYAEDLRHAYTALGTLSGETASENIIEEIFSKFCVGK